MFVFDFNPKIKASLETLNQWNSQATNHLRAFHTGKSLVLSSKVGLEAGITFNQLKAVNDQIQQERQAFLRFLEAQ